MSEWDELERLVEDHETNLQKLLDTSRWGNLVMLMLFDRIVFEDRFGKHRAKKYCQLLTRVQIERCAADAFISLHRRVSGFRRDSSFRTFVAAFARNTHKNHRRLANRDGILVEFRDAVHDIVSNDVPGKEMEAFEIHVEIMEQLSRDHAEAIALQCAGLSSTEAATAANCTEDAFRQRLKSARRKYEEILRAKYPWITIGV